MTSAAPVHQLRHRRTQVLDGINIKKELIENMDEEEDYTCDLTQEDLFELTEKLLDNDENNCAKYFRYNFQERRCGVEDVCDEPLFSDIDQDGLFQVPTIKTLMALHDNYIPVRKLRFHSVEILGISYTDLHSPIWNLDYRRHSAHL